MSNNPRIIGLAGTNGSGKDTVGQILAKKHGYLFVSVTELLRSEAGRRGRPVEREVLREISAEWRRESGLGVLVDRAVAEYEAVKKDYAGAAIASIRNPGEADCVHELGGTMVWIDADPHVRYDRIQANAAVRARVGEDAKTFEQFIVEEQAEMNKPNDADDATVNMSAVKDRCDVFLDNTNNDLAKFETAILAKLSLT